MIAIAPTDHDWLENLSSDLSPLEVNFWTPTPWNLTRLSEGDRFYFLLKAPYRKVAGYGDFLYYENMSARDAWNRFGKGNGVKDLAELVARASRYATRHSVLFTPTHNPTIGCVVLENPIVLSEDEYFAPEEYGLSFPRQVVRVKYFDVENIEGGTTPLVNPLVSSWWKRKVGSTVPAEEPRAARGNYVQTTGLGRLWVQMLHHRRVYR